MGELESGCSEFGGIGPGAGEEGFVGHFAEGKTERECGDGEKGRPMKLGCERASELSRS